MNQNSHAAQNKQRRRKNPHEGKGSGSSNKDDPQLPFPAGRPRETRLNRRRSANYIEFPVRRERDRQPKTQQ